MGVIRDASDAVASQSGSEQTADFLLSYFSPMGQLCAPAPADVGGLDDESVTESADVSLVGDPPSPAGEEPPKSAPPLLLVEAETGSSEQASPSLDGSGSDGETARLTEEYDEIVAEMHAADQQARQPFRWLRRA